MSKSLGIFCDSNGDSVEIFIYEDKIEVVFMTRTQKISYSCTLNNVTEISGNFGGI